MDKLKIKTESAVLTLHTQALIVSPVESVNGKTGKVLLNAEDVGAELAGTTQNLISELIQPQLDQLSEGKLDKVDYVQHFRGVFNSYEALELALPIATDGDYAHIDAGDGFDRIVAIWDGNERPKGKWLVKDVKVGANTDEVPEGNINLYFKSDRVNNTLLTGLKNTLNDPINPSDSILQAFAKLQGQLNSVSQAVKWVDISTVATIHPTITNVDVQLARINGLLYLKGHFNLITIPTERINAFVITDPLYKVYAMATSVSASRTLANPVFYFSDGFNGGLFFTSTDCRNAAAAQTAVQNIVVQNNTSNRFNPIQIQPVVLGDLVIK